jgi:hypothetical protein
VTQRPFSADDELERMRRESVRSTLKSRRATRAELLNLPPPRTAANSRRAASESDLDDIAIQVYKNGFPEMPLRTVTVNRGRFQATLGRFFDLQHK